MGLTRRGFLHRVAAVGGAPLVYEAMTALGLLATPSQTRFDLKGTVSGVRVVIVGGGLAGLTVAYELGKLGYACQVLEARQRPGGRAFTVRRGTVSEEDGPRQSAEFDGGLYFDAGAMRIAHHHRTTLEYCRELNVPVEVFCQSADSAFIYQQNAPAPARRRIAVREARADMDGYVAELLTKALSEHELDRPLTAGDREALIAYLRRAGALDERGRYQGSSRRGTDATGRVAPSLPLHDLLASGALQYLPLEYDYQPTMLQVTGGSDRLPAAIAARLRDRIKYGAAAREIRQHERGVSVVYADARGRLGKAEGAYCVCALPLSVLSGLQADFSPDHQKAIASVEYGGGGKIGLQFKRRFWEEDEGLFGGITRTDQEITQIVYPSHGFLTRKGIVTGYYIQGANGRPMGERTPAERLRVALEQGARIHPQYAAEFENSFSVAWHRVPYSRGSWASFSDEARRAATLLRRPDRRLYLAGDHLSSHNAWMQGAFESAREVATGIHARALAAV